jgi:hypothetical protein
VAGRLTVPAPLVNESTLRDHLAAWINAPRRRSRTLLVRAQPSWAGEPVLDVVNKRVHIVEGVSGLAALDAMRSTPDDEFVAVLTELNDAVLGTAVLLDAEYGKVTSLDEWSMVPELFGTRSMVIPRSVRDLGPWVPRLLSSWRRDRGYPPAPGGLLSPGHVVRSLLVALLELDRPEDLDSSATLPPLDDPGVRARLSELDDPTRRSVITAAAAHVDQYVGMALHAASAPGLVSTIAVGLAAGELWAAGAIPEDAGTAAARVRAEQYIGSSPSAAAAQRYGEAAQTITLRWLAGDDRHGRDVLEQAEALCTDLGWSDGVARSSLLPGGLRARIAAFAATIQAAVDHPSAEASLSVDGALARIDEHAAKMSFVRSRHTADMACRLARWLQTSVEPIDGLASAMRSYAADGAWAELALGDIWDGDMNRELATAYHALALAVQSRRREEDSAASVWLNGNPALDGVVPVERMLTDLVVPLSSHERVLLIVLDGMSVPTAVELLPGVEELGWVELVREGALRRQVGLPALPTVTQYSRTSLFAGELIAGNQQIEKARFRSTVDGVVFHKDDLRSTAGHSLPSAVAEAIADPRQRIAAAVLNTIDDALASADVDSLRWTTHTVAHLDALLVAAQEAGRIVVLTSDHGHVVERGSELRSVPQSSARWRDASGGAPQDDEVLVEGPRVLAPGARAILAISDALRYAAKKAGYHGGGSLAELAIPVIVAKPRGAADPPGWVEAPPQEPTWWNEPSAPPEFSAFVPATPATKKARGPKEIAPDATTLFDAEPGDETSPEPLSLAAQLVSSTVYADRRRLAGRHPVEDRVAGTVISSLLEGGGRAHRDTLATRVGVAAYSFNGVLTTLRRVLNVDGYPVIDLDADQVTVTLDVELLRQQFKLGTSS